MSTLTAIESAAITLRGHMYSPMHRDTACCCGWDAPQGNHSHTAPQGEAREAMHARHVAEQLAAVGALDGSGGSNLPVLDLSDFLRPSDHATEWVYGPARNDWLGTHPITAYAGAEEGEPTVELRGPLGLCRHEIPHLIAWMTAVYEATAPAAVGEVA